ncbi:MAG: hypothetical protein ACLUIQ_07435 [Dialister invisus]
MATRLICEREEEIQAFKPVEYWTVEGIYCTEEKESFKAKLTQVDGKEAKSIMRRKRIGCQRDFKTTGRNHVGHKNEKAA